ncbi:MAG: homoserine dehydrogenase [Clostridia bacterium]|nr:homoserine dehydrogenase [Clostridia bacterium]
MKIGLLGIGTVGSGVFNHLSSREDITVKRILVRRDRPELGDLATFHIEDILNDPEIDTVVEVMGGMEPAFEYMMRSIRAGKNVATANKLLLSYHLEDLLTAAREYGVQVKIDASVGGGIPYLFNLMRSGRADSIRSLFGIVNGTTNLILDTMQTHGSDFGDVLAQAQRAGYAEADPSADIDGIDSLSKLCVSASVAFGKYVIPEHVSVFGIRSITREDIQQFKKLGYVCRLLVRAERIDDDHISAFVEPTLLGPGEPETTVRRNDNLIGLVGAYTGQQYFYGQGAGKDPTAFAVVSGLADIRDNFRLLENNPPSGRFIVDNSHIMHRYYVRTTSRLSIPAEKLRGGESNRYITAPMPVDRMHALAASLRMRDPDLFIAGIRG